MCTKLTAVLLPKPRKAIFLLEEVGVDLFSSMRMCRHLRLDLFPWCSADPQLARRCPHVAEMLRLQPRPGLQYVSYSSSHTACKIILQYNLSVLLSLVIALTSLSRFKRKSPLKNLYFSASNLLERLDAQYEFLHVLFMYTN